LIKVRFRGCSVASQRGSASDRRERMAGKRASLATSFGPTPAKDLRPVRPAAAARCAEVRPPKRPVVPPRSGWSDVFLQMWSGQLPGSSGAKTQDRRQSFGTRGALGLPTCRRSRGAATASNTGARPASGPPGRRTEPETGPVGSRLPALARRGRRWERSCSPNVGAAWAWVARSSPGKEPTTYRANLGRASRYQRGL